MRHINRKRVLSVACVLLAVLTLALSVPVGASSAYQTYTYAINGSPLYSPDAYRAYKSYGAADMGLDELGMSNPADLVTDDEGNVYIADAGHDRIIIADRYLKNPKYISTFVT